MDFKEIEIKQEIETLEFEDTNENYLKLDYEVGVKVENDSPELDDWCLQNARYQAHSMCQAVKEECDVNTCLICLRMFADSYALYKHNLTHMMVVMRQESLYQCDYCLCYCTSKAQIREHIHTKHFLKFKTKHTLMCHQEHQCLICKKKYSYRSWHGHMKDVHATGEFKCVKCNMTFKCVRYLRRHLLYVHEKARPSWRFHKKIDPEQEFPCQLCPSVFKNKNSLKTHTRNCHSTSVHECMLCHSKLKSKPYLLTHMKRVHYNDGKLHKCNICCKVFKSPRYLNIHKKNTHCVKVKNMKPDGRRKYKEPNDSLMIF